MSAAEIPLGPPPEPPITPPGAVAGTFTAPAATFSRLAKKPTWWLPFLLTFVVGISTFLVVTPKIDIERSTRIALEKRAERTGQTVTDANVEQALSMRRKLAPFLPGFAVVGIVAVFFLTGLVLWGAAQAFGGETRFSQVLAVWGHAQLANLVGGILSIPIFLARPDASITDQEVSTVFKSSVGAFLPLDTPAAIRSLAGSVDLFSLATLALLVVGFRRLPGLDRSTGTAAPVVCWAAWVIIKTSTMAVFG